MTDRSEIDAEEYGKAEGPEAQHWADPVTAGEALARARRHARLAARESLAALRWLLEAASLAATGAPSAEQRGFARVGGVLESMAAGLDEGQGPLATHLLESVAKALESEIARWEERGQADPEARAVLRAFLGLREILWECGVRPAAYSASPRRGSNAAHAAPSSPEGLGRKGSARIQRVPVQG